MDLYSGGIAVGSGDHMICRDQTPDDYMQGKHLATFSKLLYKPIYLIIVFKFKGTKVTIP